MNDEVGLFEVMAHDENEQHVVARKALVLAESRVSRHLGSFLAGASTPEEFDNRISVVKDDFEGIVNVSCEETGHVSPANISRTLLAHFRPQDVERDQRVALRSELVHQSAVKTCPYHKEVMDISLASGDPASGFSAMAQHAWGPQHCQAEAYEGRKCNFKKEMVTQSYWDKRVEDRKQRAEERAQQALENPEVPQDAGEGIEEAPEPISDDLSLSEGEDAGSDAEIIPFPSERSSEPQGADSIASEPMPVAASTHEAIRGGHFLAGSEPEAPPASVQQAVGPKTPHMDPGAIQQAMQVLNQAAMSNGGPQKAQQAQSLLGQLSGVLFGGITSAVAPPVPALGSPPIPPPNVQKSFIPGLGMEPPAQATPGVGAQPGQGAQPGLNPSQMQLQQAMMNQQQAQQQAQQFGQPGSMAPTPVNPATPQQPMIASWTPKVAAPPFVPTGMTPPPPSPHAPAPVVDPNALHHDFSEMTMTKGAPGSTPGQYNDAAHTEQNYQQLAQQDHLSPQQVQQELGTYYQQHGQAAPEAQAMADPVGKYGPAPAQTTTEHQLGQSPARPWHDYTNQEAMALPATPQPSTIQPWTQQGVLPPGQLPTGVQASTISKKVPCPSCGGDGKGAGGKKCSKCRGDGKVEDWGNSVLDQLSHVAAGEGNTGLSGPEPKIDKRKWTPKNLKEIPVDDSKRNPTKRKDVLERTPYRNDTELEEIGEHNTERVELDTSGDNAGFNTGGEWDGPHTDTWHTEKGQANPVTSKADDVNVNPIQELIENDFNGFVPQSEVQRVAARLKK